MHAIDAGTDSRMSAPIRPASVWLESRRRKIATPPMVRNSDVITDDVGRTHVEDLQRQIPDWWLMYAPYRRRLVAFYMGNCTQPTIVEAVDQDELLALMNDAVLEAALQAPTFPVIAMSRHIRRSSTELLRKRPDHA